MNSNKIKLIAISGPTASGKSRLAEHLAQRFGGEIISCDSMQIYKTLDIGTAKPTKSDRQNNVYHMVDIVDPCDEFSCSDYVGMARDVICNISCRGKLPIICGGTGLYLDSVINPTSFSSAPSNDLFRRAMQEYSDDEIYEMLLKIDPESAANSHVNNRKRNLRALEIHETTGITKTQWDRQSRNAESPYQLAHITLISSNRDFLYERINSRVDEMIENGLLEEVQSIDFENCRTAAQAIGYKEFIGYLEGNAGLEECAGELKKATRNYAKRQLTWFSRYKDAFRIDISEVPQDKIQALSDEYISKKLEIPCEP